MGIVRLARVTVISPRSELREVLGRVAAFEWFHPVEEKSRDEELNSLSLRALDLYTKLRDLSISLQITDLPRVIESLMKGCKIERETLTARDLEDMLLRIENEARELAFPAIEMLKELEGLEKEHEEAVAVRNYLSLVSSFSIDLREVRGLKRVRLVLSVCPSDYVKEVERSLGNLLVLPYPLTKKTSMLVIVGVPEDSALIDKVLRVFDLKPFEIPSGLPPNPAEAYREASRRVSELEARMNELESELERIRVERGRRIAILRNSAYMLYDAFERLKRHGGLKRVSVLRGYIPAERSEEFERLMSDWLCLVEPLDPREVHGELPPTLVRHPRPVKPFFNITLNQGPPSYKELDPTPIIALVFPIFYGMMFGDLGHGIVLTLGGLLIYKRGRPNIRPWGFMFMLAGIAAMVVGLLLGEFFGLSLAGLFPAASKIRLLELIEEVHGGFNMNTVALLLKLAVLVGMLHLSLGYILDVIKAAKNRETVELITGKIPTLLFYWSFLLLGLSVIRVGTLSLGPEMVSSFLSNTSPLPILNLVVDIPVNLATMVSVPMLLVSVLLMIAGKPVMAMIGRIPKGEGVGIMAFIGLIEVFEKISSYLANTISYTRISILLMVHSALLMALNSAVEAPPLNTPGVSIAVLFIGNLGIIIIEGLIVYVQDLRLHIYEWFTKFYEGTGIMFRKLIPDSYLVKLKLGGNLKSSD